LLPVLRLSETVVQFYAWQVSDFEKCLPQTYRPGKFQNRYHEYQFCKYVPKTEIPFVNERKSPFSLRENQKNEKRDLFMKIFFRTPSHHFE